MRCSHAQRGGPAAAVFLLLAGCVVPPEIETARPAPGNQPPFVLRALPEPGVIKVDAACLPITFTLQGISDCDAGDTVSVRWFVDYDPQDPPQPSSIDSEYRGGPGVTECVRSPSSYAFELGKDEALTGGRILQLEAILSDGFASSEVPPKYRAALAGKATTRIGWTVEIIDGTGCPP